MGRHRIDAGYKKKELLRRADLVVTQGYASFPSDAVAGVTDLSAPIIEQAHAVGALAIPFLDRHPSRMSKQRVIDHLCRAAKDISAKLA